MPNESDRRQLQPRLGLDALAGALPAPDPEDHQLGGCILGPHVALVVVRLFVIWGVPYNVVVIIVFGFGFVFVLRCE